MAELVADYVLKRLGEWGVKRIYGYPGDGINAFLGALDRAQDEVDFIQVRHEEMAAFMACGHAKFTGEVGVCMATSGPGAIHLLNGLYDAKLDHAPVVAIVGQQARAALGGAYQQEVDLQTLFKDVAHNYVTTVMNAASIRHAIDRAFRIALSERCVTCVIVPKDLQEEPAQAPAHAHSTIHSSAGWTSPRIVPREEDLQRAAQVLNAGEKVAMLVGAGAIRAADEVLQVADVLGAGIAKALLGKAALPDDLPGVTGSIGLLGTKPSWDLMTGCDTLLMVGSSFPYSEFLPKEGQARGVQVDIKGRMLGLRYPMEVNLTGDSAETLRALLPYLKRKAGRAWRQQIDKSIEDWRQLLEARARVEAHPINPAYVYFELNKRLPERAIFSADSGSTAIWYARYLRFRKGMMGSLSGNLATMGPAMPYALAAKFAYPERPVFALAGDGAVQMNGMNELITVGKYWKEWKDPRFVLLVLNNRDLNMVTWEMRAQSGEPKFDGSQEIPDFPYARFAESIGLSGVKMERPEDVPRLWDVALASTRPCVVEALVDPEYPMMPPHVTLKEATAYAKAILKGDPDAGHMIKETVRTAMANVFKKGEK
ncbi:MAG: thiamine pyrophosphate-requiring protein [Actinobacteria bacterium]|nr:MAG: thiamine pyrophosphate-requiring protein [Actinomycetota bacterium]